MIQKLVGDLQSTLGRMVDEFKTSMSGSQKQELENLTHLLSQAGGSLVDFPAKLQSMTDNLNVNFRGLQDIVQQISQKTIAQSEESTSRMNEQMETISKALTSKFGDLQVGQEVLMDKQSDNLQVSTKLLDAFNNSIESMNGISTKVTQTVTAFGKVEEQLNSTAYQLRSTSENVNSSSITFKEAQLKFSQHSNQFLETNLKTLEEVQSALIRAKEVSADYAQKFGIIEKGLQGIFGQIESGLENYHDTVGSSLDKYLGQYSKALTETVDSLNSAASKQEDILVQLSDQFDALTIKK
jgi:archaellum component FlaC